jgi:hypothetical protein
MRSRPDDTCRLCRRTALLCDSHLLPKALYRVCRASAQQFSGMGVLAGFDVFTTSNQCKDYVLCRECEQRLHENGEDWVLRNCCRSGSGTPFRLRDFIRQIDPVARHGDSALLLAANCPEIRTDMLLYFAVSIFWRAAVHEWRLGKFILHRPALGRHAEDLRLYLLGGSLPRDVAVVICVENCDNPGMKLLLPKTVAPNHHIFHIPGLSFEIALGGRASKSMRGVSFTQPERPIMLGQMLEQNIQRMLVDAFGIVRG